MFKHYFERIQDVEIYPIISLVIFLGFFVGMLIWVSRANKKYIQTMKNLPLDLEPESESAKA